MANFKIIVLRPMEMMQVIIVEFLNLTYVPALAALTMSKHKSSA